MTDGQTIDETVRDEAPCVTPFAHVAASCQQGRLTGHGGGCEMEEMVPLDEQEPHPAARPISIVSSQNRAPLRPCPAFANLNRPGL